MLEFETATQPKAQKQHTCYLCKGPIVCGERYFRHSGKYDGEFFDNCYHEECSDLIDSYCREFMEQEWDYDAIWEWLSDRYCHDCKHGTEEDDDCVYPVLRCQLIRDEFREERRRKNRKEDSDATN